MSTFDTAWEKAHDYAVTAGVDEPDAFAADYAQMVDDLANEPRYPDLPLPAPADFLWP
ncbi:hypothetical protein [Microbacterium sediminis]|uniref:hypothetical protein n=1 Tax=Microbacterium TaxID=33882 RepID=UPI0013903D4E|nr:hypothetical protein [Microbacterium sediminis]